MILIADSGSTKTDWHLAHRGKSEKACRTTGLNPYFVDSLEVASILEKNLLPGLQGHQPEAVFFYGAGCSSPYKQAVIHDALRAVFPRAQVDVKHDLLAAARALFGRKAGIACILGTGSNSCVYDGKEVRESLFSLGYMFGDEGSGAHLGKSYIADHLKDRVPKEIREGFEQRHGLSKEDILTNIYKKANPNRFLASFSLFLREQLDQPYVQSLVSSCFDSFFEEQVTKYSEYRNLPLSCIGSVAFHFSSLFEASAHRFGAEVGTFMVSPMEGLIRFHSSEAR